MSGFELDVKLKVGGDGKYFEAGGKPFFWLGDTAWLMLQKLSEEETYLYLRNRKELGFNVIQTVLVHSLPGRVVMGSLAGGLKDVTVKEYWEHCDRVVRMAEDMGMYLGLLPAWGSCVKEGILNEQTMEEYAHFLGKRYQGCKNIIWILGGDIKGEAAPEVYRREGEILKGYDPDRLVSFHPFGRTSSSLWFQEEGWLDFNMFQSGHRRYDQAQLGEWDDNAPKEAFYGEDCWQYVLRDHGYESVKPVLDGEPSYEGIPQGLHNPKHPYWEEWDVRRYAYWSVLAGAAGFTYGCNAIMQFAQELTGVGSYGVREVWQDALHSPGGAQLQYLKGLMESVDYRNGRPADELLLFGQKERYHRIAVFAGEAFVICYDHMGDEFKLDLTRYMGKEMDAYWMNPQSGTYSYCGTFKGLEKVLFCPMARKERSNDWVLVLREKNKLGNSKPIFAAVPAGIL